MPEWLLIIIATAIVGGAFTALGSWINDIKNNFKNEIKSVRDEAEKSLESEKKLLEKESNNLKEFILYQVSSQKEIFNEKIQLNLDRNKHLENEIDKVSDKATKIGIELHNKIEHKGENNGKRFEELHKLINELCRNN